MALGTIFESLVWFDLWLNPRLPKPLVDQSLPIYTYIYIYININMYIYMYVCMYIYVFVCVCVCVWLCGSVCAHVLAFVGICYCIKQFLLTMDQWLDLVWMFSFYPSSRSPAFLTLILSKERDMSNSVFLLFQDNLHNRIKRA